MRLSDVIKQCKEAGATSVELYEDGKIKSLTFGAPRPAPKKLTREQELAAEQEARNPRRNAIDLAVELTAEDSQRRKVKRG
jgi:hypothetical protein